MTIWDLLYFLYLERIKNSALKGCETIRTCKCCVKVTMMDPSYNAKLAQNMSNSIRYIISANILVILLFIHSSKTEKQCTKWTPKYVDHDGPSIVYTESVKPTDGIGTQLSIFAMLWMLRRSYNVDVFIR